MTVHSHITKVQPPPPQPVEAPVISQNTLISFDVPANIVHAPSAAFLVRNNNMAVAARGLWKV